MLERGIKIIIFLKGDIMAHKYLMAPLALLTLVCYAQDGPIVEQQNKYFKTADIAAAHLKEVLQKESKQIKELISIEIHPIINILEKTQKYDLALGRSIPQEIKDNFNHLSPNSQTLVKKIINQAQILTPDHSKKVLSKESHTYLKEAINLLTKSRIIPTQKEIFEKIQKNKAASEHPEPTTLLQKMQHAVYNGLTHIEKYIKQGYQYLKKLFLGKCSCYKK